MTVTDDEFAKWYYRIVGTFWLCFAVLLVFLAVGFAIQWQQLQTNRAEFESIKQQLQHQKELLN